ncbi:hypothetical protein M197_gp16 [Haloarcula hispanica tailed virus 2]|uniref:Uncharacterized protein n=1 Tax=Haloarcula hispanica tailed virus 2 TaxID=1273751 RepID=R4TG29_9CAUD|nr:hypothetical protein M197_gp16 [Haloarcula hispanica tailed virus 2]AGM11181.1 hypothetical protein HHTV2_16 [Haloarcula hispanica tailed virus 2]
MTDVDPLEVAALRRLLHRGAEWAADAEVDPQDLSPVEKADLILTRLEQVDRRLDEVAERAHLMGLLSGDGPTKRARKMMVVDHLREKAAKKRSGKTLVRSDTVATLTDVSGRQARNYMDEIAEQVPGCSVKQGEDVGDGKQLRMDLETFRDAAPTAEALPPR